MASENETVAEAIDAVRKMIHDCPAIKGGLGEFGYQLKANSEIDRIEAAHRREVSELTAVINAKCRKCGSRRGRWREVTNDGIETADLKRFGDRQFAAILASMSEESGGYEYVFVSTRKVGGKFKAVAVRTFYGDVLKEAAKRIIRHEKKEGGAK